MKLYLEVLYFYATYAHFSYNFKFSILQDVQMHRGKPLYLNEERYAALTYMVKKEILSLSLNLKILILGWERIFCVALYL